MCCISELQLDGLSLEVGDTQVWRAAAGAANLVDGAGRLLPDPAAAGSQDLGEILACGQKMSGRDLAADAQRRAQRLIHLGQLLSLGLVARGQNPDFISAV